MDYIEDCSDERLKGMCAQCGVWMRKGNKSVDHVPSKCLLTKSDGPSNNEYPTNLPVIPNCRDCNIRVSKDEEYTWLFLNCVLAGSTAPKEHTEPDVQRGLKRHVGLRKKIQRSKRIRFDGSDEIVEWKPDTQRVNRVVVKNARGHSYYECGEPILSEPERVSVFPLVALSDEMRREFERVQEGFGLWPEVGSRQMTRILTGKDFCNGWVVVQDGVYRYRVEDADGISVKSVLREYLGTEVYWGDQ